MSFDIALGNKPGCLKDDKNGRIKSLTLFKLDLGNNIFGSIS